MKLIFFIVVVVTAVVGSPLEYVTEIPETTEAYAEITESPAVVIHHVSKYFSRFPTHQIKGSIGCSVNKTLFFTEHWNKLAYVCKDPQLWGPEEGKKDSRCQFFCQGHSVGILDESGVPSKARYDEYFDLAVPEDQRAKAKEIVHECLKTMGDQIDPNDPECSGADVFNKCVFRIFDLSC